MAPEAKTIRKDVLANGLVVITDPMPSVRSVAVGIWLRHGSRLEPAEINGISHFIEHMLFKGTEHRSAEAIAQEADRIGGMLDAFTSKELVCLNTRVIDEHLPEAFDILADMILSPRFPPEEITREKSVIFEEIKMARDNPEDLIHEMFAQNFWNKSNSLGRPILGTKATVGRFQRKTLEEWFSRWYAPNHIVITAAGNVEHEQMMNLASEYFEDRKKSAANGHENKPSPEPRITVRHKPDLGQVHICLGVPAFAVADERRFAVSIMNNLLGGGMSSRLFQNIRERQGLAYSIFSEMNAYRDAGMFSVYGATALEKTPQLVRSVIAEFHRLADELVTEEELQRAKDHIKGALLMSLESTSARMSQMARQFLYYGRFFGVEEMIAELNGVTRERVREVAQAFFADSEVSAAMLGPTNGFRLKRSDLN
jgi:predicted Zn-dependent peptidase